VPVQAAEPPSIHHGRGRGLLELVAAYVAEEFAPGSPGGASNDASLARRAVEGNANDLKYLKLGQPGRKNSWALPVYP